MQSWDDTSRLTSQTDGNSHTTSYAYDPLNRITGLTYADTSSASYQYDGHDNVVQATDPNGTMSPSAALQNMQTTLGQLPADQRGTSYP